MTLHSFLFFSLFSLKRLYRKGRSKAPHISLSTPNTDYRQYRWWFYNSWVDQWFDASLLPLLYARSRSSDCRIIGRNRETYTSLSLHFQRRLSRALNQTTHKLRQRPLSHSFVYSSVPHPFLKKIAPFSYRADLPLDSRTDPLTRANWPM